MDTNGEEQPKKTRKVKKQVRKGDLPIVSGTGGADQATKETWTERENSMYMEDKLVAETDEKKNELEASIYELRDKIDGVYSEFANEEEKDKLRAKLTDTEVSYLEIVSNAAEIHMKTNDVSPGLAVRGGRGHHQVRLRRQDG
jgi:heat shock protein 4